jgi:hypothetical protein
MYFTVLMVHSWLRWAALLLGVMATLDAAPASNPRPRGSWDSLLMLTIDCQVLLGLLLYFGLSPLTKTAMMNFGPALRSPALRFWSVTHVVLMFGAFLLVRTGRVLGMTAATPHGGRRRKAICFALATIVMAAGIPWPGTAFARPLFRF